MAASLSQSDRPNLPLAQSYRTRWRNSTMSRWNYSIMSLNTTHFTQNLSFATPVKISGPANVRHVIDAPAWTLHLIAGNLVVCLHFRRIGVFREHKKKNTEHRRHFVKLWEALAHETNTHSFAWNTYIIDCIVNLEIEIKAINRLCGYLKLQKMHASFSYTRCPL